MTRHTLGHFFLCHVIIILQYFIVMKIPVRTLLIILLFHCMMLKLATAFRGGLHNQRPGVFRTYRTAYRQQIALSMAVIETRKEQSMMGKMGAASIASAAAVAAAAVNAAVSMRPLSAPDASKSFVFKDGADNNRTGKVDEVGLPLVYDKVLIESYWKKQGSALTLRWTEFLGYAVPYLTKIVTLLITGGADELKANGGMLARDARIIFEKLVSISSAPPSCKMHL